MHDQTVTGIIEIFECRLEEALLEPSIESLKFVSLPASRKA